MEPTALAWYCPLSSELVLAISSLYVEVPSIVNLYLVEVSSIGLPSFSHCNWSGGCGRKHSLWLHTSHLSLRGRLYGLTSLNTQTIFSDHRLHLAQAHITDCNCFPTRDHPKSTSHDKGGGGEGRGSVTLCD